MPDLSDVFGDPEPLDENEPDVQEEMFERIPSGKSILFVGFER
jgi:hypothetical protein